jgi:DNA-binding GntR family transcriptional regulator
LRQSSTRKNSSETQETEKAPFLVVKRIREAILDEVFKPGDHLGEAELSEKFDVSRSPVRETLLALEKEGTLIINPYRGAIVKPLSAEEILDIAELRLASSLLPSNRRTVTTPRRTLSKPTTSRNG